MSMSSDVTGFRPPDATFKKMVAAYKALVEANLPIPEELSEWFGERDPVEEQLEGIEVNIDEAVRRVGGVDMENIWEVDITKLPEGVRFIRFTNSY